MLIKILMWPWTTGSPGFFDFPVSFSAAQDIRLGERIAVWFLENNASVHLFAWYMCTLSPRLIAGAGGGGAMRKVWSMKLVVVPIGSIEERRLVGCVNGASEICENVRLWLLGLALLVLSRSTVAASDKSKGFWFTLHFLCLFGATIACLHFLSTILYSSTESGCNTTETVPSTFTENWVLNCLDGSLTLLMLLTTRLRFVTSFGGENESKIILLPWRLSVKSRGSFSIVVEIESVCLMPSNTLLSSTEGGGVLMMHCRAKHTCPHQHLNEN